MSRLEKKCVFASAAMHGLLLVIALIGPAFLSSKRDAVDLPLLDVIPSKLVDAALSGGGNPKAKPPPAAEKIQQLPVQQPTPQPPKVEPQTAPKPVEPKPQPIKNPEPVRQEVKITKDVPEKVAPPKREIKISKQVVKLNDDDEKDAKVKAQEEAKARVRAEADARRQRAEKVEALLSGAGRSLSKNLSSSTTIDIRGPGGEAFANYGQAIISIYERSWLKPVGIDQVVVVKTAVMVARNGKVMSARIVQRSGNPAVDKSVDQVLDSVTTLPPFPEGSKDETRTFNIDFELKPSRLAG